MNIIYTSAEGYPKCDREGLTLIVPRARPEQQGLRPDACLFSRLRRGFFPPDVPNRDKHIKS